MTHSPPAPGRHADRCSVRARARGDALAGTALPTRRFLLIEDPGSWGPQAHPTGTLPPAVVDQVHAVAQELSARLLLIRRPGRRAAVPQRTWAVADIDTADIRWGVAPSADDLADVDFLSGGTAGQRSTYLVCAQGRHDVCCAAEGRPVAAELAVRLPESTWECSHVGGDRFAANVLVLPSGLVYGRVTPGDVDRLLAAQEAGLVVPDLLRGRCGIAPVAQVAEAFIRERWDELRAEAVTVDTVEHLGRDLWRVIGRHDIDDRRFVAELREGHQEVDSGLTCSATGPGRLRTWTLTRLDPGARS